MELIKIGFTGNRYGLKSEQKEQINIILDKYDNMITYLLTQSLTSNCNLYE